MKWNEEEARRLSVAIIEARMVHRSMNDRRTLEKCTKNALEDYENRAFSSRVGICAGYYFESSWLAHRHFVDFILTSELSAQGFWAETAVRVVKYYEMIVEEIGENRG